MCDSPHENVAQGAQWQFYLSPTGVWACAADAHLGSPGGTFFAFKAPQCVCTVAVQSLWGHFVPTLGRKTPQGAQKVPKGSPKAHF